MKKFLLLFSLFFFNWQINAQYCTPDVLTVGCDFDDFIDSFTIPLASFSHLNTGCSPNNYGDFSSDTSLEINLSIGTNYEFSIQHGFTEQYVRIWIDFNQDEVFDISETLYNSPNGFGLTNGAFTIPDSAIENTSTRMRVIGIWAEGVSDPCSPNGDFGEVHDYTVNILPPPSCPNPSNVQAINIQDDVVEFSWSNVAEATNGYIWEVFIAGENPNSATPISSGSFSAGATSGLANNLSQTTSYDFYLTADCDLEGVSVTNGPINFTTIASCVSPTLVNLSNVTSDSFEITWQETSNATGGYLWELYISDSDPATDTPVQSGTVVFGENSLSINGLSNNQEYDFYLTSDCGVEGNSVTVGPFSYLTLALPPANDNLCDAIPLNINEICSGNSYTNFGATAEENEPEGTCFSGGINGSVWFSFVAPASGEVQVSTDIAGATLTDTEIAVYEAPADCFDLSSLGAAIGCDQDGGEIVNFNSVLSLNNLIAEDTYYIQVDQWPSATPGDFGISVIDTSLSCFSPVEFTLESNTNNSAIISWNEIPDALEGYNWYVYELGANICTDVPVATGNEVAGNVSATITGLQSESIYGFYVESICGLTDGMSIISPVFEFSTTCELFTAPYFQDFESFIQTSQLNEEECFVENSTGLFTWDISSFGTSTPNTGPSSAFSGTNFIFCEPSGTIEGEIAVLDTPLIDVSQLSEPVLSFYFHRYGLNMGVLHVDMDDGNGFVEDVFVINGQQQDSSDDSWIQQFVSIPDNIGPIVKIRFRAELGDGNLNDIAIDDIAVTESPSCIPPINFSLEELSFDSFTLSWDEVDNATNGYVWEVYLAGEEQGVDSPISSGIIPSGTSQVIVDNLESETAYEFYIASDCGNLDGQSSFTYGIDITTTELCVFPTTFEAINITTNSVELQWSSVPNAINGYIWSIYVSGEDPLTATPVATGNASTIENSVVVDTNIISGQFYDAYILSQCSVGGQSVLSNPLTFLTSCDILVAPYSENFDSFPWQAGNGNSNNDDVLDPCWENSNPSGVFEWGVRIGETFTFETGPSEAQSGDNYLFTESSFGFTGNISLLTSPLIDLSTLNEPSVSFWYHMYGESIGSLRIDVDNGTSVDEGVFIIEGQQQSSSEEEWKQQYVDLSAYAGQTIRVIFRAERGNNSFSDIAIDSISIDEAPSCFNPTNFEVISVADTSAILSWLPGASEDVFDVEVVPAGTPPSGTPNYENISLPFTADGLNSDTDYDFYVRADCGDGDVSDWIGPATFSTIISAIIVQVDAPSVNYTYCYENNETKEWLFVSSDGEAAVQIQFEAGTIEDGNESVDRLLVYDGIDNTGVLLFDSDLDGTDLTGVNLSADSGSAYMILTTDNFGSCLDGGLDQEIAFDFNVFSGTVSSVEFSNQNFKFYPNPVSSLLTINSYYPVEEIQIFDILGKALIRTTLNTTSNTIDLNTLTNGTYLMKVKINNKTQTFKLFKD